VAEHGFIVGQRNYDEAMAALESALDAIAVETEFSGVVQADGVAKAYGLAHRGHEIANTVDTRFGLASGTKSLTACVIVSLVEEGALELSTTARSVLGDDLPLIAGDVTVEHLLAHRSGIGDYVDEDAGLELTDYVLPVPVHELSTTEAYLAVLGGHETKFPAGERFGYCNGGYVVLALIAERVAGVPFHELVRLRVCEPAGMPDTAFLRSDELPGRTALGYVAIDGAWRSNVLHLPVRGSGDGGIYSTAQDVGAFWDAFFARRIVSPDWVREMTRPRSESGSMQYGLGFWLHAQTGTVLLEGCDAGVSFRSQHDPVSGATCTVISNTTDGAWPIARYFIERFERARTEST
jgi:CubicO group peptidase (beta-lactamase class C family)